MCNGTGSNLFCLLELLSQILVDLDDPFHNNEDENNLEIQISPHHQFYKYTFQSSGVFSWTKNMFHHLLFESVKMGKLNFLSLMKYYTVHTKYQ